MQSLRVFPYRAIEVFGFRGEWRAHSALPTRVGEPEELVGTLLYFLSNGSRFVTGRVIPVDGGFNAYSGV